MTRTTEFEALEAVMTAGRPLEVGPPLLRLFAQDPADPRIYRTGFKALSMAMSDKAGQDVAGDESWQALIRALVLQEHCDERPRIFHHATASLLTSGNAETARRLAAAVLPALGPVPENGQAVPPGLVLFLTIIRAVLPEAGPSQALISKLHLAHFPEFPAGDLALSYSVKFNAEHFGANRDDLLRQYGDPETALAPSSGLGLRHLLLLDWLGAGPLFGAADNADLHDALRARLDPETPDADERAAARTLVLRYLRPGGSLDAPALEALGLDPDLLKTAPAPIVPQQAAPHVPARPEARSRTAFHAGLNMARIAVPALARLGRNRIRVALCVSGQLRGYRAALRTWQRALLPFADFDIYVHTWRNVGRSSPQPFRVVLPFQGDRFCAEWRRIATLEGFATMQDRYPHLFSALETSAQIEAETLKSLYGAREVVVEDDTSDRFASFSNQDKMHYKISAAHDLAAASTDSYDLVMRLRPDLALTLTGFSWPELLRACATSPVIYADDGYGVHYQGLMIGDQIAVGTPDVMATYAATWKTHHELSAFDLTGTAKSLTGHVSLALACWFSGIDVRKLPIRKGGLLEMERLPGPAILEALERDADRRSDANDTALLDAVTHDLRAQ